MVGDPIMPDYKNMSAKEAVRLAYSVSGMTHDQIGKASGMNAGSIKKFADNDSYLPNLDRTAPLCRGLGNVILLQWLEAQFEQEHDIAPAKSRAEVLTVVARASASLGDVQRVLADSEDRGIDPPCAREARSLLQETISQCRRAYAMLDEQASHRDINEIAPLASMKQQKGWFKKFTEYLRGKDNEQET